MTVTIWAKNTRLSLIGIMEIFEIPKSFVITRIYTPRKAMKAKAYYKVKLLRRLTGKCILNKSYMNIIEMSKRIVNTLMFKWRPLIDDYPLV